MYIQKLVISSLLLGKLFSASNIIEATINTIDAASSTTNFSLNYFAPSTIYNRDSPFYRGAGDDWNWALKIISSCHITGTLSISVYGVDNPSAQAAYSGDVTDEIYDWEASTSTWNSIRMLDGTTNTY